MKKNPIKAVITYKDYELHFSSVIEDDDLSLSKAVHLFLKVLQSRIGAEPNRSEKPNN